MAVAGNLASEEPFSVTMDKVRGPQLWREGRYDTEPMESRLALVFEVSLP